MTKPQLIHQAPWLDAFTSLLCFLVVTQGFIDICFEYPGRCVVAIKFGSFIECIKRGAVMSVTDERLSFVAPGNGAAWINQQCAAICSNGSSIITQIRTRIS